MSFIHCTLLNTLPCHIKTLSLAISDINECTLPNPPCKNGATCNNKQGDYQCNCTEFWMGKDCNEGMHTVNTFFSSEIYFSKFPKKAEFALQKLAHAHAILRDFFQKQKLKISLDF